MRRASSLKRRRLPLALLAVVLLAVGVVGGGRLLVEQSQAPVGTAAERFLDRYVTDDGRVVRYDQGGDTVSEGQAYAMLLAVAVDDEARFARVWKWTRANLQRPDGLLAWLWRDGEVVDRMPAADADLDAVRALLLAAEQFDEPAYEREGLRIADAILREETILAGGDPLLMAGPWATQEYLAVNPSYFDPQTFTMLEEATGEEEWEALGGSSVELVEELLDRVALPADWAVVNRDADPAPTAPPGQAGAPARYSLDAARLPIRFAGACDPGQRELAASLWPVFADDEASEIALAYDLGGTPVTDERHPLTLVGAAAAAHAAGEAEAAQRLMEAAAELDRRYPSYYGAAWVALGHLYLAGDRPACDESEVAA